MQAFYKRILSCRDFFHRISSLTPDDFLDELIPRYQMYQRRFKLLRSGDKSRIFEEAASGQPQNNLKAVKENRKMLIESFLMFFLYQECKLTQGCLAKLFGCGHRSTVRRRLRTVIGIQYLTSTRSVPSKRQSEQNVEEVIDKLIRDFPSAEKKLIAVLRMRRTAVNHRTIRTPEEFFALYPQLAGKQSVEKTSSDHLAKHFNDVRRRKVSNRENDRTRLKAATPKLTPECYKNSVKALKYLIEKRWNGQIKCALCGTEKVYTLKINASPKQTLTGAVRFKCAWCRRKFTVITGTKLSGCRLQPAQILKAVYYIAVRPRRETYTLEKFASEIGVTGKTAAHFVDLLRRNLTERGKVSASPPPAAKPRSVSPKRSPRKSFLKIRNSIPGSADEIITVLLEPAAKIR